MNKENLISALWLTFIGEFYNSEHEKVKSDLLNYFDDYMKNNPSGKSGEKNRIIVSVNALVSLVKNNKLVLSF